MFALPGIIALIVFILLRPQEFVPALEHLPMLHIALVLALAGLAIDVLTGNTKLRITPVTIWGIGFFVWSAFTLLVRAPSELIDGIERLLICVVFGLVVAHSIAKPQGLGVVAGAVLFCALVLAGVGIHQGLSPKQCLIAEEAGWIPTDGTPDGRFCQTRINCYQTYPREPGTVYLCEHVGLFGTTSIGNGRVRYRGVLKDPNELALAIGISLPIAFAMRREHGGLARLLLALLATIAILVCTIFTGSRGGQLVMLAVLGTYFVGRTGKLGVISAGVLAIPALIYGGRSGSIASSSTSERIECWYAGIDMFIAHPIFGVGHGRFTEHHYLTAHNTYLLSLAEMGPLGLFLFIGLIYSAARVPYAALGRYTSDDDPRRAWAIALLAAMSGLAVGIFFLSFSSNHVLWLFVGLVGAYYTVLRNADEGFRLTWRMRDTTAVGALALVVSVAVYAYTRIAN